MCVSYCSGVDRNPDSMCSTTIAKVFMFSVAAGCIYATLHPAFRRPKYRSCRAGMYAGLGLSFVISMAVMTTFNSTGGALYAMRVSACVPYGRRVTQGCDRAGNSPDSREMVPLQIRNMGLEPSNHALYGGLCWYRAFIRAFEGV
jgi:hypothetical protein